MSLSLGMNKVKTQYQEKIIKINEHLDLSSYHEVNNKENVL